MATTTVARGSTAGRPARPRSPSSSTVGRRQEVRDGDHRHLLMGFVFAHMVGNLKMYLGPRSFDHYGECLRELLVPILPRTCRAVAPAHRLDRRLRAPHPRRLLAHPDEPRGPAVDQYQSHRDYVAANFASRTMRWTGVIVGLFLSGTSPTSPGAAPATDFVRGEVYENVVASLSRSPVALALHRRQHRPRLPPLPRRLEPLPEPGVEQPALQPLAPLLRRRRSPPSSWSATSRSRSPCWPASSA